MTGRCPASPGQRRLFVWTPLCRQVARGLFTASAAVWLLAALTGCVTSPTPTPPSTPAPSASPALPPTTTPLMPSTPAPAQTPVQTPTQAPMQTPMPILRVGVDAASRPWCYRDATGELVGLDVELLTALAAQMGVQVEYVNVAPHLLLPGLAAKRYDLVAAGLVPTAGRLSEADLSDPYFSLGQAAIVRATDILTGPVALNGKVVGVQIGTPAVAEARRLGATVRLYDDLAIALGALARGEVPAVIGDDLGAAGYLKAFAEAKLRQAGAAFAPAPIVLAVAKDQPALLARVNTGLAALRQTGALDRLASKWLP